METLQRERPRDFGPWASEGFAGARILLSPAKNISTEEFAEAVAVLADLVADYCSWDNGLDPWGGLTEFYQRLDATMVPEQVERRPLPRVKKRR